MGLDEKRRCRAHVRNGQADVVGALGVRRHFGSLIYLILAPSLASSQIRINIEQGIIFIHNSDKLTT